MILIADSGATKTDWLLADKDAAFLIKTEGINPFHQDSLQIESILKKDLMPQISEYLTKIQVDNGPIASVGNANEHADSVNTILGRVYFYGAGCLPTHTSGIEQNLHQLFPKATIEINTDLLGAARALCGHQPGIACILGTGANSCLYNGKQIERNISPLGYILGDEGSGAYLGKRFLGDCFKEQLPTFLRNGLLDEFHLTYTDVINKVYREPQANRFLANLTPYIYKQKEVPEVHTFLIDCFETFFRRNVLPYHSELAISFTGSISWFFQEEVKEAAKNLGLQTGTFLRNPIEGMASFHKVPYSKQI